MVHAERGDWLIIERAAIGQPPRRGLIVGVRSVDGAPLYRVRWGGNGHISLISPGPDARVVKATDARLGRTGKAARNSRHRFWRHWRRRP